MGPTIDSRIQTLDARVSMLQIKSKAKAIEHNSLAKYCYDYMHLIHFHRRYLPATRLIL